MSTPDYSNGIFKLFFVVSDIYSKEKLNRYFQAVDVDVLGDV
jgi:hypothetical protein